MKITISFCLLLLVLSIPAFVGSEEEVVQANQQPLFIPNDVVSWKDDPCFWGYDLSRFTSYREFVIWLRGIQGRPFDQATLADYYDTSLYMIGNVSVSVILPESDASSSNTEDWTPEEIAQVHAEIIDGLNWWAEREPNAHLNFIINFEDQVEIPIEPIEQPNHIWQWRHYAMDELGYGFDEYGTNALEMMYGYVNDQIEIKGADWGFIIFVVDSSNDADGKWDDGKFAWATLDSQGGGPYLAMTSDNALWGFNNMDAICAHEVGHVFGAVDQYVSSGCGCDGNCGYLYVENQNCENSCLINEPSIMKHHYPDVFANNQIDVFARGQVGWTDDNANGILDIVDFEPIVTCSYSGIEEDEFVITGSANTDGLEAINTYYSTVKITEISGVEYSVDDGEWTSALAMDGSFDSLSEDYTIRHMLTGGGDYVFRVRAVDRFGEMTSEENYFETSVTVTGVEGIDLPEAYSLSQNYPNPFNPSTTIKYYLPENCSVQLEIFDVSGKHIASLVNESQGKGPYAIDWNGKDQNGNTVSSGTYFYRLKAGEETISKKMVLLR